MKPLEHQRLEHQRWRGLRSLTVALIVLTAPGWRSGKRIEAQQAPRNTEAAGQDDPAKKGAQTWVGKKAEGFTLPDSDGKEINVAQQLGKRPVVLVFYRGVW